MCRRHPQWADALTKGETIFINENGEASSDFCFVMNAVQANLLAACASHEVRGQTYNVCVGNCTTLNQLFNALFHGVIIAISRRVNQVLQKKGIH